MVDLIIKHLERKLLSDDEVFKIADASRNSGNLLTHNQLAKVGNISKYLDRVGGFIVILWEEGKENYGHWTCLIKHRNPRYIEYFDSYALPPDAPLDSKSYGIKTPFLTQMLNSSGVRWVYNHKKLQKFYDDVNTCGRYVGLRLLFRKDPLNSFIALLTKNKHYPPDFWVSALTLII